MSSFVLCDLWKLALSRTTISHSLTTISHSLSSGQRHSSIHILKISVLVLPSNLIGASTVSSLTQARRVVRLYLYPYWSERIDAPISDQPRLFTSLWSIQLSSIYTILLISSIYTILPTLVIFWIFSRVSITISNASLYSSFLSRYLTSFFYNCSSYSWASWV